MNIAIIGYGVMGSYHAKRFREHPRLQTAGIFDIDPARCAAARAEGLHVFASGAAVAASPDVDAVVIATPNELHKPYVQQFAAAGKHILCEKPAACSAAEFTEMTAAAAAAGVVLMVSQNRRLDRDFLTARAVADSGILGRVYSIESAVTGANGIPGGWRKEKARGGGMMLDWGVHLLDQLLCWYPQRVQSLSCHYSYTLGFEVEDGFTLRMQWEGGPAATVRIGTNDFIPQPRWMLYGTKGTAVIEDWELHGRIVVRRDTAEAVQGIAAGNGFTKTMGIRPASGSEQYDLPAVEVDLDALYTGFADACGRGEPAPVRNEEVLRVLRLMECAARASETNSIIKDFE